MRTFFHSIRWRVQAWHGAILLTVILGFCLTSHRLAWNNQLRSVDRSLAQTERTLIRGLMQAAEAHGEPGPGFSPRRLADKLRSNPEVFPSALGAIFQGREPGFAYFSLRDADNRPLLQSPNVPEDVAVPLHTPPEFAEEARTVSGRREIVHRTPDGLVSIIGMDLGPERREMRRFAWSLVALGGGVWLVGLLGGWWLAGRAIQPVADISRTASRIAEGNLEERIVPDGTNSELDQLSRVLNATFDRLHAALERQKQFTADASHELRTPVTILLSETQRILKRDRTPEEYRAVIQTCQATAQRMRQLTEALLLLARQDRGAGELRREPCDLAAILRTTAAQLQPLADARGIQLRLELETALCMGDPTALSILTTNLVGNAVEHHDRAGGVVVVGCGVHEGQVRLAVSDDGPGIPAADLPHVFDRFYRVDSARSGGSGHVGLGLAIAKAIATNHGGDIVAENLPGRGCRFSVQLPARSPSARASS
ncbi:sensor histidine kinase [Opitutaceae bacterium EW11]|nr:sensor histidine kinase [Opitutaceae bacterium EW11]